MRPIGAALAALALSTACKAPASSPGASAVRMPAAATSSTAVAPWGTHLAALRGRPVGGGAETNLLALAAESAPTVFAFWATYCPPCIAEMPMFEAAHRRGSRVIGVSLDAGNEARAEATLRRQSISYPNVILDEASMKAAGLALTHGLPATVILDAERRPLVVWRGKIEPTELDDALRFVAP